MSVATCRHTLVLLSKRTTHASPPTALARQSSETERMESSAPPPSWRTIATRLLPSEAVQSLQEASDAVGPQASAGSVTAACLRLAMP
eukprot:scaffold84422_cov69-Phaeocystis_antarctica.AAC.2